MRRTFVATCVAGLLLALGTSGCSTPLPRGQLPAHCTGVPGDLRSPASDPTRGPITDDEYRELPLVLDAVARPATGNTIPLLYAFDDDGKFVTENHPYRERLSDPAFVEARKKAFWGETTGDGFYFAPWLDACSQASMLDRNIEFRAPANGILFMQFVAPGCTECAALTRAVRRFIAEHPETPVRWIEVRVSPAIGHLE